jgi:RsiW-degrading membrane proteinase PrsW (M82 family)
MDVLGWVVALVAWLGLAVLVAWLARRSRRDPLPWLVLALLSGPVALLLLAALTRSHDAGTIRRRRS